MRNLIEDGHTLEARTSCHAGNRADGTPARFGLLPSEVVRLAYQWPRRALFSRELDSDPRGRARYSAHSGPALGLPKRECRAQGRDRLSGGWWIRRGSATTPGVGVQGRVICDLASRSAENIFRGRA